MIDLFEHNRTAYENAVSVLKENGKAAVVHPTGTGKSFIGFKLAEENPQAAVCWLSPSEYTSGPRAPPNRKTFVFSPMPSS